MRSLHPTGGTQAKRRCRHRWHHAVGYGVLFAFLGQAVNALERLPINNDTAYAPQPRLQVDLDDGSTCQVTDRSPASLMVYGRWRKGEESIGTASGPMPSDGSDVGGGVALMVPLGGLGFKGMCNGLLGLQQSRARFALAQQLLEAGQLTDEEMKQVVNSMRKSLGLARQVSQAPEPAPARPAAAKQTAKPAAAQIPSGIKEPPGRSKSDSKRRSATAS